MTDKVVVTEPEVTETPILPSDAPPAEEKMFAGKYKTVEDLEKGYKELESKLGAPKAPPPPAPAAAPPKGIVPPVAEKAEAVVAEAGLNWDEFTQEFATNGELSEASYEKLTKSGIPKDLVDSYIEGQKATQAKQQEAVYASVGGEAEYTKMAQWAAANLTNDEKIAYNASLVGDVNAVKWAVAGLKQKYEAANGVAPSLVKGDGTAKVGGYANSRQMIEDMKDPRYKKDPAFRKAVEDKVSRSNY